MENHATDEQSEIIKYLIQALNLSPLNQPYDHIRQLQTDFDYTKIHVSNDTLSATCVNFSCPLKTAIGFNFSWNNHDWLIPAIQLNPNELPTNIPGITFCARSTGDTISFQHPITHVQHRLYVTDLSHQQLPSLNYGNPSYDHPTHYLTGIMPFFSLPS